jgi:DNA-binding winged helix-turn-helix (wHTH) protein
MHRLVQEKFAFFERSKQKLPFKILTNFHDAPSGGPSAGPMTVSQTSHLHGSWTFGPYILDAQGHLRLGPSSIHLAPLQRRLLLALVRQRGQVLSREQLLREVWGHHHVSEVSISRTVHSLRRVLADGPLGPSVIRTIYGGGYRLEVPTHPVANEQDPSEFGMERGASFPSAQTLSSFVEGLVWVRQRDPRLLSRAGEHLRRCVEMAPDFTPALVRLASTKLAQYRWGLLPAQALEPSLDQLLQQADASGHLASEVLALRVEALSLLHWQPDLAEGHFASWLPAQLLESASLHSWASHLLATGRAAQALPLLEPHLTPDNPDGWMLTATAWWLQGKHHETVTCLQQQLQIDGGLVAARLLLALVLADAARPVEALGELESSGILANPQDGLQAIPALVLALCGKSAQAAARLQAVMAEGHQNHMMTSLWGLTALALEDEAAASLLLERAVEERCGLAPLIQHIPGLQRHANSPALGRFKGAMTNRFRCTF